MSKYIDAKRLRAELEKRLKNVRDYMNGAGMKYKGPKYYKAQGKESAYDALLNVIDSLQQEQQCAGLEDVPTGIIKDTVKELLELAKKELYAGCIKCADEYWRGRKEAMEEANKGYHYTGPTIPTYFPPCFLGGPCTNPMYDCINCPRQSTIGINTNTGTSTAKVEG